MICSHDTHAEIKACPVRWASETYPIADGPVMDLEWANCRTCHSTLARETTNEGGAQ